MLLAKYFALDIKVCLWTFFYIIHTFLETNLVEGTPVPGYDIIFKRWEMIIQPWLWYYYDDDDTDDNDDIDDYDYDYYIDDDGNDDDDYDDDYNMTIAMIMMVK